MKKPVCFKIAVPRRGFALLATIMLMVLLIIIAVGTLTLSAVALRTSSQDSAQMQARANARMALMIAIGELQKQMGPDQRISANSSILSESTVPNAHWLGAWNSWKAGTGAASQHSTIVGVSDDMAPTYEPNRRDHFRSWLVSLHPDEATLITTPSELNLTAARFPNGDAEAVELVGVGSLGEGVTPADIVNARLINVADESTQATTGRYGWWVGDESQKARVMSDSYHGQALTSAEKIFRSQAPASTGTTTIAGLSGITPVQELRLKGLVSLKTLDLVPGVQDVTVDGSTFHASQKNFHHTTPFSYQILADVREGGLKRDLSTLLERPINITETGDEFMLYRFDDAGEQRVPIQDLAAYYQLYDDDPNWDAGRRGGVDFNPSTKHFQVRVPNYGTPATRDKHLRQHASIYSSPVPVRIQYVLALGAVQITEQERLENTNIRETDTHKLLLGVVPIVSLWNPTNLPMVLEQGNTLRFSYNAPPFGFRLRKYRAEGPDYTNRFFNLNFAMTSESSTDGRARRANPYIMRFRFAASNSISFEPGEVKIFSFPSTSARRLDGGADAQLAFRPAWGIYEPVNAWDPFGFFVCTHSATTDVSPYNQDCQRFPDPPGSSTSSTNRRTVNLVFNPEDRIAIEVEAERQANFGLSVGCMNEIYGGAFNFSIAGESHMNGSTTNHFRNYQFISRFGGDTSPNNPIANFNRSLIQQGFPSGNPVIPFDSETDALRGSDLIAATQNGEARSFLVFSMMTGCEAHASQVGGYAAGRKTATRPFLHGSSIAAPLVDSPEKDALYNVGWEWQVDRINGIEEAVQMDPGTGNAYFGGGYTAEAGTTHVVQQHLPAVPPISIAALSSSHLGGFSLAKQPVIGEANEDMRFIQFIGMSDPLRGAVEPKAFQKVTATGAAGLAPHVMQAIGNSYAHPNIPANQASTTKARFMDTDQPSGEIPFVDHSYLANKALWDDYFFSSITPQLSNQVPIYEESRTLEQVAEQFFFGDKPLPNRRMTPYTSQLDESKLTGLLGQADQFTDGMADKIAAHLMVEGGFNVNSTSVEAWKVFLSSLKGKPVSYLNNGVLAEESVDGVPVGPSVLGNAQLVNTGDITSSNNPPEQWTTGRVLGDQEIEELADAIVRQVRERGPFLSMSDFINRRLEGDGNPAASARSVKGALQAALDDPAVSINANFRTPSRVLDSETGGIDFLFPDAAKGPIAYGSTAYVDQADLLSHFAEQLTPRGDTFVIRAYGDSLDAKGKVEARAWCEAVVQRVPDYVNPADAPHLKQAAPELSAVSAMFGRKIQIISFRWLNDSEV